MEILKYMDESQPDYAEWKKPNPNVLYDSLYRIFLKLHVNQQWEKQIGGDMGIAGRKNYKRGMRKRLVVMDMFIIFITVRVSSVSSCVIIYQTVYSKYV